MYPSEKAEQTMRRTGRRDKCKRCYHTRQYHDEATGKCICYHYHNLGPCLKFEEAGAWKWVVE